MRDPDRFPSFRNRFVRALMLVLVAQTALFYSASRSEKVPPISPLQFFPMKVANWAVIRDMPLEPEVQDVLKADDTLNRAYHDEATGAEAYLFIAYFKSQRFGQAPHSPKNCLPGSGWEPVATGYVTVNVAGQAQPITINRYVVEHGNDKSAVLYWYQSRGRVIANEFAAKYWLVADSIRYHRSDTSLVRIVVPVRENDLDGATRTGVSFAQTVFPALRQYLGM